MKAAVVYESLWGNTAAIARAVAEGIGPGARALSTVEATPEALDGVELLVGGAPLLGFSLPTDSIRDSIARDSSTPPADFSAPSMRTWLRSCPSGTARCAGFETAIWWSPGSSAKTIARELESRGYRSAGKPMRFLVTGRFGPLKDGELDRARAWGASLVAG